MGARLRCRTGSGLGRQSADRRCQCVSGPDPQFRSQRADLRQSWKRLCIGFLPRAIWKIPSGGGTPSTPWISDPLLLGNGTPFVPFGSLTPPFGANGVEFSNDGKTLFVANTAFHQIIQIPVTAPTMTGGLPTAGTPSIFITGINAPDGIAIDSNDNIWICANQEDEIVVIDNTGKVIAKLGDFEGIDPKGIVRGLLFPASLAFSNDKSILYVSNLTLFLPFAGAHLAIDSDWTLQVQGYTVSKLPAKIPPIAGD